MQYMTPKLIAMDEVSDPVGTCHNCETGMNANYQGYHCANGDQAQGGYCSFGCNALYQISGANGPGQG